ncbi:NAD(P)/FAD-dependent oxidoreductase [Streptomyces hirsutus]
MLRAALFSDKGPVFSGEHAYRAVISVDDAHGMVTDDNLRMYIGRSPSPAAWT